MKIRITEDWKKEILERKKIFKKIKKGEKVKATGKTLYFTPKTFSRTFTPERLRLMFLTRKKKIGSISELAKELKRPFESVHRDIKYLEGLNLITLEKHDKCLMPIAHKINFLL